MSINKQQRKARSSGELDDVEYSPEDNNGARDVRINSASLSKRSGKGGIHRRVVSVPVPLKEMDGGRLKGDQSSAPPSDSWAWRKYGQKPIKGSPYPRGYYRCSSSKGCPARKQVERSNQDPNMLIVTYTSDHNHPSPAAARAQKQHEKADSLPENNPDEQQQQQQQQQLPLSSLGELPAGDFVWFSDYEPVLEIPIFADEDRESEMRMVFTMGEEDASLFGDLGELPECSRVFDRRAAVDEIVTMF